MGNKRNRRSRRHETPSPERELSETQVETPMQGNETKCNETNVSTVIQEPLGENENRSSLIEPSQISNEIQVWTENFEQKNNDRIMKMREEMENKFDAILKEIRTSKTTSTITNPRSEINGMDNRQLHRQSSQNPQSLNDTVGSYADQTTSPLTNKPLDPVNQIAQAIEKLANKNSQQSLFHPKNTLTFNGKKREKREIRVL